MIYSHWIGNWMRLISDKMVPSVAKSRVCI